YAFGGAPVEATGMVHPDVRRRGLGAALLDDALELARGRGRNAILLVAPRTSVGARVLAGSRGGVLEHSEHAMDLDGPAAEGPSDPTIDMRAATPGDAIEVARILADAFGDSPAMPSPDGLDPSTLVAERDGRVIATLRVHRSVDVWGVYGFAVDARLRGRGVGRDLLRRVSREAQDAGVDRLHLEVSVDNDHALGLYTSVGFTRTATEDYYEIRL
ncbi:MAG TPA: GNAT family N-acetyltransferase, partial [Acidimicrobiales bacterium]|nr:GNAT family N-acetyltransferase [Acidimicrobiales bacterium]